MAVIRAFLVLLLLSTGAQAADVYILDGGTGDGSAWDNALDDLPDAFTRGNTYWVGDGAYGPHVFSTAESTTTAITVKKATAAAHGTETGWVASYGDGVAVFTGTASDAWLVSTGYWTFDGVVGSGTTGHGFKVTTTYCGAASRLIWINNGADSVSVQHVEFAHCGEDQGYNQDAVYVSNTSVAASVGGTLAYCYLHDVTRVHLLLNYGQNWTINNNVFANRYQSGAIHGEAISMNYSPSPAGNVIRHNIFKDIGGPYTTAFIAIKDSVQDHVYIHDNLFYQTNNVKYTLGNGAIANTGGDTNTYMYIYGNTFANVSGASGLYFDSGTNNTAKNNLWFNCDNLVFTGIDHDYNWFYDSGAQTETNKQNGAGDPFTASGTYDFTLAAATVAGDSTIGASYNTDLAGVTRGTDGTWDRGAYESAAGAPTLPGSATLGTGGSMTLGTGGTVTLQ